MQFFTIPNNLVDLNLNILNFKYMNMILEQIIKKA